VKSALEFGATIGAFKMHCTVPSSDSKSQLNWFKYITACVLLGMQEEVAWLRCLFT